MKNQITFVDELNAFERHIDRFPWENKEHYANWVAQTYYFAKETTKLLTLAAAYTADDFKLHFRFIDHAKEEKGHEKILLNDLANMGMNLQRFPELTATSSIYQPQYYWIQQNDPRAFFGYIIFLEGIGAKYGKRMYERAAKAHGHKSAMFLKVHAEDDVDHIEKAVEEVSRFDERSLQAVKKNFAQAADCYALILRSIASGELREAPHFAKAA